MKTAMCALALLSLSGCVMVHATVEETEEHGCSASATTCAHPEEAAILAVVDKVLLAIGNHDYAAQAQLMVPEGTTFLQRTTAEGPRPVQRRTNAQLMTPGTNNDPFIERYWSPTVRVRGDIAMVWAPYELRDNGQVVHCGIDSFDMVKLDGQWKVGNLMSTMEPGACAELQPPSVSAMRPRDGWRETRNE